MITFSGPTEFAPIIQAVISKIGDDIFNYYILLILTDGVIDDLQETIDCIVAASLYPLSIIIVGIGNENFEKMKILDGDEVPLVSSTGQKRLRDLVQFVSFSKFQNDEKKLAEEVLAEIPKQIVDSDAAAGVISRGVSDLWNYDSGNLSKYFYQRAIQLIYSEKKNNVSS